MTFNQESVFFTYSLLLIHLLHTNGYIHTHSFCTACAGTYIAAALKDQVFTQESALIDQLSLNQHLPWRNHDTVFVETLILHSVDLRSGTTAVVFLIQLALTPKENRDLHDGLEKRTIPHLLLVYPPSQQNQR